MIIKPIKPVERIQHTEIPDSRISRNQPRAPVLPSPPEGAWKFEGGRIILNGQDVGQLIEKSAGQPAAFWTKISHELKAYRDYYLRRYSKKRKIKVGDQVVIEEYDPSGELGHLAALVDAYIAKIMRMMKRRYDSTADGIEFILDDDGQLILNGVNVTSFIEMTRQYPSQKARTFLKGLKTRLSLILANKGANPNYEKISNATRALCDEIDKELERIIEKERLLENSKS